MILTNGERTEMLYLSELKRQSRANNTTIKVKFESGDPTTLLRKVGGRSGDLVGYDEVWLVVDEDGQDRSRLLQDCIRACSKNQKWVAIISVPSFEVWLISHFQQVRRYSGQKEAAQHFRSLIPVDIPKKLLPQDFPYENMAAAMTQCRLLNEPAPKENTMPGNPGSAMPLLVERLDALPE